VNKPEFTYIRTSYFKHKTTFSSAFHSKKNTYQPYGIASRPAFLPPLRFPRLGTKRFVCAPPSSVRLGSTRPRSETCTNNRAGVSFCRLKGLPSTGERCVAVAGCPAPAAAVMPCGWLVELRWNHMVHWSLFSSQD